MIRRIPVSSSNIREVAYEEQKQELEVVFTSGAPYVYSGVQPQTFNQLTASESVGRFFHSNIRDVFPNRPGSLAE